MPHTIALKDEYLKPTEDLIMQYPDIFAKKDYETFRTELIGCLLKKESKKLKTLLLVEDKAVLGVIMYSQDELSQLYYKIKWLIISRTEQRKGYGKQLLEEATEKIKELGGKYIYLETSGEQHNHDTQKFYDRMGFKKMGTLPDFYPNPVNRKRREDSLIYYKEI
jgi:ribosomal protein S18 acetylase RimI-like enzyme